MANMIDYLEWRGDLSFCTAGFNEVDNLLLAQLAYVDFDGIVPGQDSGADISLREASDIFWSGHDEEEILSRVSMTKWAPIVMRSMAETERFCNIRLSRYVNDVSDEEQSQFSVVCAALADGSIYVAFSGTDDTIVGWRENFNMGYLAETPGQLKAVQYLNRLDGASGQKLRVGGHSKGGNLSVYAAVKCLPQIRKRILTVYSNDGPGFNHEMTESAAYRRMLPRIKTILPESSIVGMLLEHQENYEVVKSSQSGIQQHDALSWEVLGASFVYVEQVAMKSVLLDETMKAWLCQLKPEERQAIVDTVFSMLEAADIRTVDDFYRSKWKKVQELLKATNRLPEETQQLLAKAVKLLWTEGNKAVRRAVKEKREGAYSYKKSIKSHKNGENIKT